MKPILLIVLLGLFSTTISAQDWCHQGAKWHYYWVSLGGPGLDVYTYTGDTVVVGRPCHQLSFIKYTDAYLGNNNYRIDTTAQLPLYTYATNDTTYFYYAMFSEWLPVYFINAHAGDTLVIPNYAFHTNSDSIVHAVVDSAGITVIDTNHLRYYSFHVTDSCILGMTFSGKVIERLGMVDNAMVPFYHCRTDGTGPTQRSFLPLCIILYKNGSERWHSVAYSKKI